jgi:hypothetical protein
MIGISAREAADRAEEVSRQIEPLLAGLGPDVQGAILANLTAMWLAGHMAEDHDDHAMTATVRMKILQLHMEAVCSLIAPSERELRARMVAMPGP